MTGANFGRAHPDHALRYEIAEEFVGVVKQLWDCWDDDAIVADRASGLYIDPAKVHALNHDGKWFQVKGPLNIGRSPQGQPIVLQAGGSAPGQRLAARTADVVFSVVQDFDEAQKQYASFKALLPEFGRQAEHVTVLPGSYLARDAANVNPGKGFVRIALVDSLDACVEAAKRIAIHARTLTPHA